MTDPLKDPNFPNRPQHPDFWQLAQLSMKRDAEAMEGKTLPEFAREVVDEESLYYMAEQRVLRAAQATNMPREMIGPAIAVFFDAFLLGHGYGSAKATEPAA